MAMKMTKIEYGAPTPQILAIPDHKVAIGVYHAKATAVAPGNAVLVDGRYIVKAGTIYPANDATAIGIVQNDYDVTDGDDNMAVLIHAFIKTAALPVAPAAAAIGALTGIQFLPLSGLITTEFETVTPLAYVAGAETATSKTVSLKLKNGLTFKDAATTADNWTFTNLTDSKLTVDSIALSADRKTAIITVKSTTTALVAKEVTALPAAGCISVNKAPADAILIASVAVAAGN